MKQSEELSFWRTVKASEGALGSEHFRYFFTEHFGLDGSFYSGKRILDIGCGPRGSLEWASMAAERVGLDPLVDGYRELGITAHSMRYVGARAEQIPFPDSFFDVIASFNSLDHVDSLEESVAEIKRVLAPGGTLLLLTDVNHNPTPTEPIVFSWDVVDLFLPEMMVADARRYEKAGKGVYDSVRQGLQYDQGKPQRRYGVLAARLLRA